MNDNFSLEEKSNQELWDNRISNHMKSWYDIDNFKKRGSSLDGIQIKEVGNVNGKHLLHLQCNIGIDTLSWAREGAIVTGVDFSPKAINIAKKLKEETNINAQFICSNIFDLKEKINKKFDIVYTSQGVLCWLKDLSKWASVVNHFLKPNGIFYIMEIHPFINIFDYFAQEPRIINSYFNSEKPEYYKENEKFEGYEWTWSLSNILNALIKENLTIKFLNEYDKIFGNTHSFMERIDKNWWHIPGLKIPLMFTLKAIKQEK